MSLVSNALRSSSNYYCTVSDRLNTQAFIYYKHPDTPGRQKTIYSAKVCSYIQWDACCSISSIWVRLKLILMFASEISKKRSAFIRSTTVHPPQINTILFKHSRVYITTICYPKSKLIITRTMPLRCTPVHVLYSQNSI